MIIFFSCQKGTNSSNSLRSSSVDADSASILIGNYETGERQLNISDSLLQELYSSSKWTSLPASLKQKINLSSAKEILYDNEIIRIISFDINYTDTNHIFKSLIVYTYNNKFLPIIIQNKKLANGNDSMSLSDVNNSVYYGFQVNNLNKVGHFTITQGIPFESLGDFHSDKTSPTCMQTNTTYSGCLSCAITECVEDWVCEIACGLESAGCLSVWAVGCAFHA